MRHEYFEIEEAVNALLATRGFTLTEQNDTMDPYPLISSTFAKNAEKVLLFWDGRGGYGYARYYTGSKWIQVEAEVPEGDVGAFRAKIDDLCEELRELLNS